MSEMACLKATITGLVQGVFFRDFVRKNALSLGLRGFVRNQSNGSVEVMAEGEIEALKKLMGLLNQGPPRARVEKVNVDWCPYSGNVSSFNIRY